MTHITGHKFTEISFTSTHLLSVNFVSAPGGITSDIIGTDIQFTLPTYYE
ncbi:MAG: hypothetical protein ACRD4L_06770 [Pyrinomonadaceae bacterium]